MLKKYISFLFITVLILSFGCSSSDKSINEEETNDEVYVFDEVPVDSTIEIDEPESNPLPVTKTASHYIIQIGAFTTREKADLFAGKSGSKITDGVTVSYNHEVNLFVVQLNEKFKNKKDALSKRDSLRLIDDFKDAWVITVY